MDAGSLGVLVPITAMIAWAAVKISKTKAEAATLGTDPRIAERLEALEQEVGSLRQELSETHERLDFTERLLAQHRSDRLDPPR